MTTDERDILDLLKDELDFIEKKSDRSHVVL